MVGKKKAKRSLEIEVPVDLASRIGAAGVPPAVPPAAPEPVRRLDGPLEPARAPRRERPAMIGLDEAPATAPAARPGDRPAAAGAMLIGLEESFLPPPPPVADPDAAPVAPAIPAAPREAPTAGELDLVVTPLATPDDWHHFELALRRIPGVGALRTEYYRAGILKLRLRWSGVGRFAQALATLPGYRVGVLGEDRTTLQIRVTRA